MHKDMFKSILVCKSFLEFLSPPRSFDSSRKVAPPILRLLAAAAEASAFRLVGGVSIESESELRFLESEPESEWRTGRFLLLLLDLSPVFFWLVFFVAIISTTY